MNLVWTVKLYNTGGAKDPFRVKIEGNPSMRADVPWVFAEGKGPDAAAALTNAIGEMSEANAAKLLCFVGSGD